MEKDWTAREILQLTGAYWASCALQTAVTLDVFTHLDSGPKDEAVLAAALDCNPRAFAMLMGALAAMNFVKRSEGELAAVESVLPFLSRNSSDYLGFIIKHQANILPAWSMLETAVRTGKSVARHRTSDTDDPAEREAFLMGMFNIACLQAERIADAFDLSGKTRLIDVGGGPGTYAIYFCRKNPELQATIFDLPTTQPFAEKTVKRFGLEKRIAFKAGNFISDTLPEGHDVAWLSQVLHGEAPEDAAALVASAGRCLLPGGFLCVQEFMLDDDRSGPEHAALFSLNMLVQTPGGQSYSRREIRDFLLQAGAKSVRELELPLPQSCRVHIGQMPS